MRLLACTAPWLLAAAALAQTPATPAAEPAEPRIGIRFEGLLPGTHDPSLSGEFPVEFRIYLSPQGGDAVWSEARRVRVADGRMDVLLGEVEPVPFAIHEATFKFLGASVSGGREVYPRFPVVNTVFASRTEALRSLVRSAEAGGEPVYPAPGWRVSDETRAPATWSAALAAARASGGDLPDYRDWYGRLTSAPRDAVLERCDHYEWVLPWVYDTASHGEYNRLFRGRFEGCDYMDLSPSNEYPYRVALPPVRGAAVPDGSERR